MANALVEQLVAKKHAALHNRPLLDTITEQSVACSNLLSRFLWCRL